MAPHHKEWMKVETAFGLRGKLDFDINILYNIILRIENRTLFLSGFLQNIIASKHIGNHVKINKKLWYYIFLLDVKTRQIVVLENLGLGSLQL